MRVCCDGVGGWVGEGKVEMLRPVPMGPGVCSDARQTSAYLPFCPSTCHPRQDPGERMTLAQVMEHPWATLGGAFPLTPAPRRPLDAAAASARGGAEGE